MITLHSVTDDYSFGPAHVTQSSVLKKEKKSVVMKTLQPTLTYFHRVQELCESRGGRPAAPRPNEPYGFCGRKATLNHAYALVTVCP